MILKGKSERQHPHLNTHLLPSTTKLVWIQQSAQTPNQHLPNFGTSLHEQEAGQSLKQVEEAEAGLRVAQEFSHAKGCVPAPHEGTYSPSCRMQVLRSPFSYALSGDLHWSKKSHITAKRL